MIKIKQQHGAVLVVSLLVLLVMTMISLAAVQTNVLEERMAGNMHDKNLAFQAAEAGLRAGENRLRGFSLIQLTDCEVGDDMTVSTGVSTVPVICYEVDNEPADPLAQATWDDTVTGIYTEADAADYVTVGGQNPPKYYVTSLGRQPSAMQNLAQGTGRPATTTSIVYFRVTARGTGGSDNAQSILRSYFAVPTN